LQALDAQIRDVDRQIAEEGRRIAASLDTQAKIEGELERSLQDEITRLKLSASGADRSSVELAELVREATAKRNLLNTFLARQNEATARTNTGAIFPDVRIISTAAVPTNPSWPNKPMMLILVAALSLLIQVGMVIIRELVAGNLITARGQQSVPAPVAATQEPIVQHEEPASAVVAEVAPQLVQTETATVKAAEDLAEVQAAPAEAPPAPETHDPMTDVRVLAGQVIAEKRDVVLVATGENNRADSELADALLVTLTTKSRTAIVINAGGRDQMATAGLTDMCAGEVDFGQIIHRGQKPNQYFVPWGTKDRLDFNSERFTLMIEALSEVYDHVIVECGRVGLRAPLAPFADSDALLVMVSSDQDAIVAAELISDLEAVGINQVHQLAWNNSASNVA
jgi:Mrp family chromosome partitioning ATPase